MRLFNSKTKETNKNSHLFILVGLNITLIFTKENHLKYPRRVKS